jgi:hypothetical protein
LGCYSSYSSRSLLVISQPGGSRHTAHRKKRAVKTTCSVGRENNLVPGPLYGGSPVHVRSVTMVGCWDGRQVTAPPSYLLGRDRTSSITDVVQYSTLSVLYCRLYRGILLEAHRCVHSQHHIVLGAGVMSTCYYGKQTSNGTR